MEKSVKDRLLEFLEYKNIGQGAELAEELTKRLTERLG